MAITSMTGTYPVHTGEGLLHAFETASNFMAEVLYKYGADDNGDFGLEVGGTIGDEGTDNPRGWCDLQITSSFTEEAEDYEIMASTHRRAADILHKASYNLGSATLAYALEVLADQQNALASAAEEKADEAEAKAAEEVRAAQSWFYEMAAYHETDYPYSVEECEVYQTAENAGADGWDAVHAYNQNQAAITP